MSLKKNRKCNFTLGSSTFLSRCKGYKKSSFLFIYFFLLFALGVIFFFVYDFRNFIPVCEGFLQYIVLKVGLFVRKKRKIYS